MSLRKTMAIMHFSSLKKLINFLKNTGQKTQPWNLQVKSKSSDKGIIASMSSMISTTCGNSFRYRF